MAAQGVIQYWQVSNTICVRLSRDLAEWLEEEARKTGVSQGAIVRNHLERERRGGASKPFMRLAGAVRGPRNLSTKEGFSRS